jgi:hypothetical protein
MCTNKTYLFFAKFYTMTYTGPFSYKDIKISS